MGPMSYLKKERKKEFNSIVDTFEHKFLYKTSMIIDYKAFVNIDASCWILPDKRQ